jgi:hypothetical protein
MHSAVATTSALLARELDVWVTHAVMPRERICPAERLVVSAKVTSDLLLPGVVDSVLMAGQVVRTRKDSVAGLAGAWVDAIATVGASLRIEERR